MKRRKKKHYTAVKVTAVGPMIATLRKQHRIRQKDLADQVGISPGALTNFEKGRRNVSLCWLIKIAAALDIKPSTFLDGYGLPKVTSNPRERRLVKSFRMLSPHKQETILDFLDLVKGRR